MGSACWEDGRVEEEAEGLRGCWVGTEVAWPLERVGALHTMQGPPAASATWKKVGKKVGPRSGVGVSIGMGPLQCGGNVGR